MVVCIQNKNVNKNLWERGFWENFSSLHEDTNIFHVTNSAREYHELFKTSTHGFNGVHFRDRWDVVFAAFVKQPA